MNRIIDVEKLETALHDAVLLRSNREAAAGRMAPGVHDAALRIQREVQIALLNQATIESANIRIEELESSLSETGGWMALKFALRGLQRDVIMSLMRVTDDPGKDRQTFLSVAAWLHEKSDVQISETTGAPLESVKEGLAFFRSRVPVSWASGQVANPELGAHRDALRPIRDYIIAHAGDYSRIDSRLNVPKVRGLLVLSARLSDAMSLLLNIRREPLQDSWGCALEEASRLWDRLIVSSPQQDGTSDRA